tara:strand:- start:261 stop:878 length:618 start_codon:yes stop_codon:yes gene_type:complete
MNATITPKKPSFKQQQMQFRENAILDSVNRLLSQKGFDLMTMDEVAADVGIAKASLYKHFPSKESLAAASMTRLLDHTLVEVNRQPKHIESKDKLKAIVRWGISLHLQGEMPYLPSTRSSIQQALLGHEPYIERIQELTTQLGDWILDAQEKRQLSAALPAEIILYTIFARACDPVADFLKMGGAFTDSDIIDLLVHTCFDGLTS